MAADTKLIIRIITDAKDAVSGIGDVQQSSKGFNETMRGLAAPAGIALGAITALGAASLSAASDLEQSAGGVTAVYGEQAREIQKFAKTASDSLGLSETAYNNFAAVVGAQFKNLGVPMDQVAGNTNDLITLGADLAAAFGGTTTDAVNALSSALRGEADPAEKYGLSLNQAAINAYLAEQGLAGLTGEALTAAKAQAVLALASEQAGGAVGQAGREAGTVAGQQQKLAAKTEEAAAALGEALLPIMAPIIGALAEFAGWVQQNSAWLTPLIAIIGALAAAVIAYTVVQWAMNVALTANPIGLIIVGIGLLIAAIITLGIWIANNTEQIKAFFAELGNFFADVWANIVAGFNAVVAAFATGWQQIASFFASVWAGITAAWDAVVKSFQTGMSQIGAFFAAIWNGLVQVVRTVFNAIQAAINAVVSFFQSAWQGAVNAVTGVLNFFGQVAQNVFNAIMGPIKAVIGFFNQIVSAIQNVISWLGRIKIPDIFGAIGGLFGGAGRSAMSLSAAPATFAGGGVAAFAGRGLALAVPSAVAMGGGGDTFITVEGGLDSADSIARRIAGLLQARDRRAHGVTISRSLR